MAPLVWPSVCRYSIEQSYSGRNVANILDVAITDTGGGGRGLAIQDTAEHIITGWNNHILPLLVNDINLNSVSWVDLDTLDGETGTAVQAGAILLPKNGTVTTPGLPGNVSALVAKQAPGGGRNARNGRWYLAGIPEAYTGDSPPNNLIAANVTALNNALESFRDTVNGAFGAPQYTANIVVLHTANQAAPGQPPDIEAVGDNVVTAMTVDSLLATQRRRLRG